MGAGVDLFCEGVTTTCGVGKEDVACMVFIGSTFCAGIATGVDVDTRTVGWETDVEGTVDVGPNKSTPSEMTTAPIHPPITLKICSNM